MEIIFPLLEGGLFEETINFMFIEGNEEEEDEEFLYN